MVAKEAFTAMVQAHVGPPLRAAGFRGSAPTWRLTSPSGDVAIVNLQRSRWDHGDAVTFYVNLAVLPALWWQCLKHDGRAVRPRDPVEAHGLLRRRLDAPAQEPLRGNWSIRGVDPGNDCGRMLQEELQRIAVPELRALLDRDHLAAFVCGGAQGWWVTQPQGLALAFIVAGAGRSPRVERMLDEYDGTSPVPRDAERSAWLRRRLEAGG